VLSFLKMQMDSAQARSRVLHQFRDGVRQASGLLTTRNLLFVILALALWWRLVYVTELPGQSIPGLQPLDTLKGDATSYDSVATNLLDGRGYLNSVGEVPALPPAYPTLLAGIYEASAHSLTAVRIVQAVIGAATCAVVFFIGRKAFNPAVGLVAASLAAAYPWFIFWERLLITETLFIFVLSMGVLAMLWAVEKPVPRNLALVGLLLGLANLTHTTVPVLPVLFGGWLVVTLGWREGTKAATILLVTFFLTLAPWTVHNLIRHDAIIPVSAHGGVALYVANNPYAIPDEPHYSKLPDVDPADMEDVEEQPFLEKDRILRNKALNYILDHPRTFASNGLKRLKVFWESAPTPGRPAPAVFNMPLVRSEFYRENIDYVLLMMSIAGGIAALTRWRTASVLLLLPTQFSLLHLFFPVMLDGRSRVGTMQVVVIFAAFAVYAAWRIIISAPAWTAAIRDGVRERSLENTWKLIRHPRKF
jgi:hypothetical protein